MYKMCKMRRICKIRKIRKMYIIIKLERTMITLTSLGLFLSLNFDLDSKI